MAESRFTWFPKLTATVEKVPEEQQGALLLALIRFGTYDEEPELEWPLDAIFESLRDDIENSKKCRANGEQGGRGNKKSASNGNKPPFSERETPLSDSQNTPSADAETPLCETGKGGSGNAEPKPYQSIPIHTNPDVVKRKRFTPPTADEVDEYARAYCRERDRDIGDFSGRRFVDFYESKGWLVGKAKMRDWKATVRNWLHESRQREVISNEYSNL